MNNILFDYINYINYMLIFFLIIMCYFINIVSIILVDIKVYWICNLIFFYNVLYI